MKWDITAELVDIKSRMRKYKQFYMHKFDNLSEWTSSSKLTQYEIHNLHSSTDITEIEFLIKKLPRKNPMFSVENPTYKE